MIHYDTMVELSSVSSGCVRRKWSFGLCKHPALAYVLLATSSERIQIFALRQEKEEKDEPRWNKKINKYQTDDFFHSDCLSFRQ